MAYRIWYVLSLSVDALAVPAQVFVSSAIGAGDPDAARRTGRRTPWLGLLAGLAFVFDGLILGIADYSAMPRAMILAILAFAPMAVLTARFHWLGLPGIWAALGLWLAARSALLARRWHARSAAPLVRAPARSGKA